MKNRMKKLNTDNEGFTLVQVVTALGVLLIIASIAGIAYSSFLAKARASVCKTNLQTLNTAVDLYGQEYGALPATLGDLKLQHFEKAYAQVMERRSWYTEFSHAILKMNLSDEAYAEFLTYENLKKFGAVKDSFSCPEDDNGGTSYGINANLVGVFWANVDNNVIVVADCDSATVTSTAQLKNRHGSGKVAHAITKGGAVVEFGNDGDDDGATFDVDDGSFSDVQSNLQDIIDANSGTELATRMQNVNIKVSEAGSKLAASQNAGAVSELEAAIGVLESAISDGLLDPGVGQGVIDTLTAEIGEINSAP